MFFFLREGVSFRSRMISPPGDVCGSVAEDHSKHVDNLWALALQVRGGRSGDADYPSAFCCANPYSRNARKQATSFSPGGTSFPHPIHERGQSSKPRRRSRHHPNWAKGSSQMVPPQHHSDPIWLSGFHHCSRWNL